jgi:hypothetical protein
MRASWRDIKNWTMTKAQRARAHTLAMRDLKPVAVRLDKKSTTRRPGKNRAVVQK